MAELSEGGTDGHSLPTVEEGGANFGFGGGGHDIGHDLGEGMDGAVEGRVGAWCAGRVGGPVAEEVVAAGTASGFWLRKVGGVTVDVQDHVAGVVADGRVWMRGGVIDQPKDGAVGVLGGFGLLGCEGAKSDLHGWVDGNGIIQEGTDDLLDEGDGLRGKDR